jgi:hypothetical protein
MSDRMQRIAARQQPGRIVPIAKVLELLDAQAELARSSEIMSTVGALTEIREQLVAIGGHDPLPSDEERAALDAYSVVKADRTNGGTTVFTNGVHREALMAAVHAVDEVRFRAFADSFGIKLTSTETPALSREEAAAIIPTLTDHQIKALRYVAAEAIRYRGQVVVSRHLNKSSARALARRGLLAARMNPSTSWGFALTPRGKAVADVLNSPPYRRP